MIASHGTAQPMEVLIRAYRGVSMAIDGLMYKRAAAQ
jgi:hypothetical protein